MRSVRLQAANSRRSGHLCQPQIRRHQEFAITWIYVFTLIVVITFAIEIGQKITGTGSMEFADIAFGILGFVLMYAAFVLVRAIFRLIFPKKK